MPNEDRKEGTKLVIALSVIVGVSLMGILALTTINIIGKTILPIIYFRIFVNILFWFSFVLMAYCIYKFIKLSRYLNTNKNVQSLAALGLVVAIAHVGQFAAAGLKFFIDEQYLPEIITNVILYGIFLVGFAFVIYAIYIYKKV